MMEDIKALLKKLPLTLLLAVYLVYTAYDYVSFLGDVTFFENPASPLILKNNEITQTKLNNTKLAAKVKQAKDYLKTLDAKRAEIRRLALELENMKTTLPEFLDVPDLMKTLNTEAKKIGLTVIALKPTESSNKEFYSEQTFDLSFRGAYIQVIVFLERLSNIQKIVRVDNFSMRPISSNQARVIELEGIVQIKAYRYLRSKADELGKSEETPVKPDTGASKESSKVHHSGGA